ncbi:MAG TPA: cellulose binding domain-containing protein [Cellvibrio sp.]|nr:cellulose binding domain-containing protein [Cellvibrio sp.]
MKNALSVKSTNKKFLLQPLFLACLSATAVDTFAACTYTVTNNWGSGFTGEIKVTNDTAATVNNWSVSWQESGATVTNAWNATLTGSNPYTAASLNWNGTLAPKASASFGFQANGTAGAPKVNGSLCGTTSSSVSSTPPASSKSSSSVIISSSSKSSVAMSSSAISISSTPASSSSIKSSNSSIKSSSSSSIVPSSKSSSSASSSNTNNTITLEENQTGYCNTQTVPVETDHAGYLGTGYSNPENAIGKGLEWKIDAQAAGSATVAIRYANGGTNTRIGNLSINAGADGIYTMNQTSTGAWTTWQTITTTVQLQRGTNNLQLLATTADGLANIDSIKITGPGVSGINCAETPPTPTGPTLAFPGAQGFGRLATGGREGTVVHVTNLNDSGSGSLRDAISQPNRIVVFDVSGVIKLDTRLVFKSNQTIAGQTAPGKGISIYGNGVSFSGASNTIVRYVRFRMGKIGDSGKDTVAIANGHDIIFDNVSLSWGRDGTFDLNQESGSQLYNITLQDSIVAQGLQTHSTGGLINTTGTSIIRSLYIDNNSRNPKARGTLQFVNNVIYNWVTSGYILGDTSGRSDGAMIGNYFITGPETNGGTLDSPTSAYNLYAVDNWYDSNKDGSLNGRLLGKGDYGSVTWWTAPSVEYPPVPALSATAALQFVINNAGTSHQRDEADDYVLNELKSYGKKGKTISDETSLGITNVVGNFPSATAPKDTDRDGMPDTWETQNGFNPNSASDAMLDKDGDGWVNVEEYINSLVP